MIVFKMSDGKLWRLYNHIMRKYSKTFPNTSVKSYYKRNCISENRILCCFFFKLSFCKRKKKKPCLKQKGRFYGVKYNPMKAHAESEASFKHSVNAG